MHKRDFVIQITETKKKFSKFKALTDMKRRYLPQCYSDLG